MPRIIPLAALGSLLMLLSLGEVSTVFAQFRGPQTELPDSAQVVAVRFEGDSAIGAAELQSVVTTYAATFFDKLEYAVTFGSLGAPVQTTDEGTRARDTAELIRYYRDNGFENARVTCEERPDSASLAIAVKIIRQNMVVARINRKPVPFIQDTIIFHVSEGPPALIAGVAYEGLENLPSDLQNSIESKSLLKKKMRYSSKAVSAESDRISSILNENGYPFFKLDSITVDPANPKYSQVTISFTFETGHRYRIGGISIVYEKTDNEHSTVSRSTVMSEVDLDSGSWYKASLVNLGEVNLRKLGTFDDVRIALDTSVIAHIPDSARDGTIIPITIFLRMRTVQEISAGIFGGSGALGFSFGGSLGYTNRNIFGGGQVLDIEGTLQILPPPSTQTYRNATLNLTFPFRQLPFLYWLFPVITNAPLTIGVAYSDASQVVRYTELLRSIHAALNITIGDPSNHTLLSPDIIAELAYRHYSDPTLFQLYGSNEIHQINAIGSLSGQWDRTDNPANATKGFFTGGTIELGTPFLHPLAPTDGSADYVKWLVSLKDFIPLAQNGILTLGSRLRIGEEIRYQGTNEQYDVPIERRLYVGGGSSDRGWPSQALLVAPFSDSLRLTTEGGYKSFEFTLELRWSPFLIPDDMKNADKLLSPIQFAFFFDAGQGWDDNVAITMNQLALSIGTGVRYVTFIGALRFDIGFKLYDPNPNWGTTYYPSYEVPLKDQYGNALPNTYPAYPGITQGVWLFNRKLSTNDVSFSFNLGEAF